MKFPSLLLSCALLAACSSGEVRDTFGLNREAPDEFRVVSRPPLSVPPEFYLEPPRPGELPLGSPAAEEVARGMVLPASGEAPVTRILEKPRADTAVDPVISSEANSNAESVFLSKAGVTEADPEIRATLEKERRAEPQEVEPLETSPLESWLGMESGDPVVDARAEAGRIRENKDAGKPITEGEVKTVDPAKDSVIDKIFNDD